LPSLRALLEMLLGRSVYRQALPGPYLMQ
jgi:hypothetical protein